MLFSKPTEIKSNESVEVIEERKIRNFIRWISGFTLILALVNLFFAITMDQWPFFLLAGLCSLCTVIGALSQSKTWDVSPSIKLILMAFSIDLALVFMAGIFPFFFGFPIAFIGIGLSFLFVAYNRSGRFNNWIIAFGLLTALVGLTLRVISPFPQFTSTFINSVIIFLSVVVVVLFIRLTITGQILFSLRIKLTAVALAIALIPLLILSAINSRNIQESIKSQSNESLKLAAQLTVNQMDNYISSTLNSLETEAELPLFRSFLKMDTTSRADSEEEKNLIATLRSLQATETIYVPEYAVLDRRGLNIYDTLASNIGSSESTKNYFTEASNSGGAYASSVEFEEDSRVSFLYFIAPIVDTDRSVLGYLRMQVDARILQSKLIEMSGVVGTHSYPILLDENGLRLADSANPNRLYHLVRTLDNNVYNLLIKQGRLPTYIAYNEIVSPVPEIESALFAGAVNPYEFFDVNVQQEVTGILDTATYGALTNQNWTIVFLQEQSAIVAAQESLARTTTLIAILIAAAISLITTIVSSIFTKPITDLTDSAVKIASGDFSVTSNIRTNDEIGILGNAFNSMTAQLKDSIETLETRVRERTNELAEQYETLQYRSRQLQTVSDVARQLVSTTDFDSLLNSITTLISDRFNFYHVGIFLIDDLGEFAVLRASNSIGGQRMLDRQHKLKVGQVGIVGNVTGTGQPRIATDVGKDAVFFNNPDLPETKSEMALPLKIEDRIIGALDIQSTESNAFTEADINLFSTLADQASVAINNNQLLARTEKALAESQSLHRQYLEQEWTRRAAEEEQSTYKYTPKGLMLTDEDLPEIKMVFDSNRPVTRTYSPDDNEKESYSVLAVPILLRGQAIGVIHLRQNGEQELVWSENELVTVQNVADQVAQTLESARLFEQTIRRADRERRVLEVTNKIRSTNDPQKMLEVTLEELKKHLGASQTQIVINVPGVTSSLVNSSYAQNEQHSESTNEERKNP
jgi:GAF domain-containing protein/HAMP domain-containing protein